jgi:hypothetical protein
MDAALPVNHQNDFAGVGIDINDDFVNECSDEAFLQPDISTRPIPDSLQIRRQVLEFFSGGDHGLTSALYVLFDALLDLADMLQGLIPTSFQLVRH